MSAASRSLATALWAARFASGLLRLSYTTNRDTTEPRPPQQRRGINVAHPKRDNRLGRGEPRCRRKSLAR